MTSKISKPDPIRVAVIDDHPLMREGIVQSLARDSGIDIVAEGESAADAISIALDMLPDVMLIDVNMPGGGLEALREISASCPAVATIIITVREDEETVGNALAMGARGFMTKGATGSMLVQTIRDVNAGSVYITPSLEPVLKVLEFIESVVILYLPRDDSRRWACGRQRTGRRTNTRLGAILPI